MVKIRKPGSPITIRLDEAIVEALDEEARKQKTSRNAIIRGAVLDWLRRKAQEEKKTEEKREEAQKLEEAYMRKVLFDFDHAELYGWVRVE
ncbi:MAG: ribbon-helix-helix domain-containing protein [Candidatus Bathyarchaeales archaeon]